MISQKQKFAFHIWWSEAGFTAIFRICQKNHLQPFLTTGYTFTWLQVASPTVMQSIFWISVLSVLSVLPSLILPGGS